MAGRKEVTFDKSKLIAGLKEMASTPNEQNLSLMDHLKDPDMMAAINELLAARYTINDVARKMTEDGFPISGSTLGNYLRVIKRETGDTDGKQAGKSKTTKPRTTEKPAEAKTNTNAATSGNATAAKSESGASAKPNASASENPSSPATAEAAKQPEGKAAINPAYRDRKSL